MAKEFHIKQCIRLVGNDYKIKCDGKDVYKVEGNGLRFGNQASFQTLDGTELASFQQTNDTKLTPWKKFEVHKDGKLWGMAKQEDWGALDKKEISIDIPGDNDYKITGNRVSWKFDIMKGDTKVGEIDKKWGIVDNYGVRVEEGADEVDILLCGIMVDHTYHDDKDK